MSLKKWKVSVLGLVLAMVISGCETSSPDAREQQIAATEVVNKMVDVAKECTVTQMDCRTQLKNKIVNEKDTTDWEVILETTTRYDRENFMSLSESLVTNFSEDGSEQEMKSYMMEENEKQYALQDVQTQLLAMVTENATVSGTPQELIDRFYQVNINNMTYNAMMYGMDLQTFVSSYYGLDEESFEAETVAAAEISAEQALVCLKIAADENITVTDEEIEQSVEENYAGYGYASAEEFKTTIDMEEYRDSLLLNKIVDFLVENATLTEVPELTE